MVSRTDQGSAADAASADAASDGSTEYATSTAEGSRISQVRKRVNGALSPTDPYLPPLVGLFVGLALLMVDLGAAEAPSFLRVSALFGSILLITDSTAGLIRAFGRTESEPEQWPAQPAPVIEYEHSPTGTPVADRERPGRAYTPPEPEPATPDEEPPQPGRAESMLPTVSLIIAVALALASLGTATTSMRLLSIATAILLFVRLYLVYGPRRP